MKLNPKLKIFSNYFFIILGILMIITIGCPESGSSSGGGGSSGSGIPNYTITINLHDNANTYDDRDVRLYAYNTGADIWERTTPYVDHDHKVIPNDPDDYVTQLEVSLPAGNYDLYVYIDTDESGIYPSEDDPWYESLSYTLNTDETIDIDVGGMGGFDPIAAGYHTITINLLDAAETYDGNDAYVFVYYPGVNPWEADLFYQTDSEMSGSGGATFNVSLPEEYYDIYVCIDNNAFVGIDQEGGDLYHQESNYHLINGNDFDIDANDPLQMIEIPAP